MSNQPTQSFFFPDPFGTGESVYIEAATFEDALKQLKKQAPKDEPQPQDSAPAPEADESQERTNH